MKKMRGMCAKCTTYIIHVLSPDEGKSVRWPDLTGFRNVGLGNRKDLKRQ